MKNKLVITGLLLIAVVLILPNPVSATLQIAVTAYDTTNTADFSSNVIVDNGPGDTNLNPGVIKLADGFEPIPDLVVQGSVHSSTHGISYNLLKSSSLTVTNEKTAPARAYVAVSDTDFEPRATLADVTGSGTFVEAGGSTFYMSYWNDPANGQGANNVFSNYADFAANAGQLTPGSKVNEFGPFTAGAGLDSFDNDLDDISVSDTKQYSMTLLFDFTLTPDGTLETRSQAMVKNIVATPEFPSLALPAGMIIGLLGAVLFVRRTGEE